MSQRTRILFLIKSNAKKFKREGSPLRNHAGGYGVEDKHNYNLDSYETYDPVSNWVIEMDPKMLRKHTSYNDMELSDDEVLNEKINNESLEKIISDQDVKKDAAPNLSKVNVLSLGSPLKKHVGEYGVKDKDNYNLDLDETCDPISNWVTEVDPKMLKKHGLYNDMQLSDDEVFNEKINNEPLQKISNDQNGKKDPVLNLVKVHVLPLFSRPKENAGEYVIEDKENYNSDLYKLCDTTSKIIIDQDVKKDPVPNFSKVNVLSLSSPLKNHAGGYGVKDKHNYNLDSYETYDPISNWVVEMDPKVLKKHTSYNDIKLSDDEVLNEEINNESLEKIISDQDLKIDQVPDLNKANVLSLGSPLKNHVGEYGVKNKDTYNLDLDETCDPISNWATEVDRKLLKKHTFYNYDEVLNEEINNEPLQKIRNDRDGKKDPLLNLGKVNVLPLGSPLKKHAGGYVIEDKENYNSDLYKLCDTSKITIDQDEKTDPVPNRCKVNVLSHWLLGKTGDPLPIIVVPPQEQLNNLLVTEYDLPIIIEEGTSINIENMMETCDGESSRELVASVDEMFKKGLPEVGKEINRTNESLGSEEIQEGVERTNKRNYKDKKTFCFYCDKDVTHFSRHLVTWHQNEIEVQRILSYKCNSRERRNAISALGKRGNYVRNRISLQLRPVRRVESVALSCTEDYLPCPHCIGYYKRKCLYRHTKQCSSRTEFIKGQRQCAQSDGQTALLMLYKHDELLKKELFPRMRADEIALTAKKDSLICNYAYSYMKGRRSKGNLDLVRQNMRRLAKLLQFAREENKEIHDLIDLLRPTFFDIIINGVNKIGKYNKVTDIYESPTVAINFGTLIKKCCDLAYIRLLQIPNTEAQRKDLKILKRLVESQWADEVSAQAGTNLNAKKWNKEELLPLTSDVTKLKNYLEATAQKMFEELHLDEKNHSAYNTFKEVIYTQIILMNRRRPAEVSQLKVETYKSINLDNQENEFESCLTETEKILLNSCSRIVIRGKRGRGVPILLLSPKMREHFDFLLKIRDNFIENNDYIFHTDGKSFIDGTKIIYKHALKCGAENPKCISATKLRKHLATVSQLLEFSKSDLEQLSKFMGHTLKTHCDFYRLSDNMYQTAKISKLLLLATEGGLEKYKGMQLDDINIDLSPITEEYDLEDKICSEVNDDLQNESTSQSESQNLNTAHEQQQLCKRILPKQPWSHEQKKIISEYFTEQIKNKRAPKQSEVNEFMEQYPGMFPNRKWTTIKAVVYNIYTGKLFVPV